MIPPVFTTVLVTTVLVTTVLAATVRPREYRLGSTVQTPITDIAADQNMTVASCSPYPLPMAPKQGKPRAEQDHGANGQGGQPDRGASAAIGRELRPRGQATLRRLMEAGVVVFGERGYHATRIDDIVEAAKTSHGTFYLYFKNKDDLFRSVAREVAEEMSALAGTLGPLGPGEDGYEELRAWIARYSDLYGRFGGVIQAWAEAGREAAEFSELGANALAAIAEVVMARIKEGGTPTIDPQMGAILFIALLERSNHYATSGYVEMDRQVLLDTLARSIHRGFLGGNTS